MNWKLIVVCTVVFWLVSNIFGMFVTGYFIHEKILDPEYQATEEFWQPALRQDPPDVGAMMPRWLLNSFLSSLVIAGIYSCVRGSFNGPGWKKGATYGFCIALFTAATYNAWSGVFHLPGKIWIWWIIDTFIVFLIASTLMGWAGDKWAKAE